MKSQIKINLFLAFLLVLIVVFGVFFIRPIFLTIKNSPGDLAVLKQDLLLSDAEAANLEKFKKDFPEIKPNLEKTSALFINAEVPIDFVGFLEKISQECQISLSISSSAIVQATEEPWPFTFFQLNSAAPYADFLKFLEKLESSQYLVEIQNLNISRLGEADLKSEELKKLSAEIIGVNLSLKVYSQ